MKLRKIKSTILSLVLSAIVSVSLFTIPASATSPTSSTWTSVAMYDTDVVVKCIPTVNRIDIRDTGAVWVMLTINNYHLKEITNLNITKFTINIGDHKLTFKNKITNKSISPIREETYTLKIPKKYVTDITENDLKYIQYTISYNYKIDSIKYKSSMKVETNILDTEMEEYDGSLVYTDVG